jgi:hypothetical protein
MKRIEIDAALFAAAEGELLVCINHELGILEYIGPRALLESEEIIPADTKWPERFDDLCWKDGNLEFRLQRERPKGARGPSRAFLEIDWWCLRIDPVNRTWQRHRIMVKARELKALMYQASSEGVRALNIEADRLSRAQDDERFQGFLARTVGRGL